MSNIAIRATAVSKKYRIGTVKKGSDTLLGKITDIITAPVSNFRKLSSMNRLSGDQSDVHCALKNVTFEVREGEVMGIIGHNGAGKSTLLKILSRITPPSSGQIEITGRVSSLLEVGTGFHPELTGRDNIFMNGTIHGMKVREIKSKLDEIVEFSGVGKYIDTPVKFFSSGMKVRLGFAVAAHLEPDVLVIDEVLAVGDFAFQQKCLGKMKDVASGGRTVLFVSHDMNSVVSLCSSAMLLRNGEIIQTGNTQAVVSGYHQNLRDFQSGSGSRNFSISDIRLNDQPPAVFTGVRCGDPLSVEVILDSDEPFVNPHLKLTVKNFDNIPVTVLSNVYSGYNLDPSPGEERVRFVCSLEKTPLVPGTYKIDVEFRNNLAVEFKLTDYFMLEVLDGDFYGSGKLMKNKGKGILVEQIWTSGVEEKI